MALWVSTASSDQGCPALTPLHEVLFLLVLCHLREWAPSMSTVTGDMPFDTCASQAAPLTATQRARARQLLQPASALRSSITGALQHHRPQWSVFSFYIARIMTVAQVFPTTSLAPILGPCAAWCTVRRLVCHMWPDKLRQRGALHKSVVH